MQLMTRSDKSDARARVRSQLSKRGEEGNLVLVLVLIVGLTILSLIAVGSVIGGISVASSTTAGAQAVAQVNAGVSDALFHLDQMGDSVHSYCVGTPPAGYSRPPGVDSCLPSLADAPSLEYYGVERVSSTLVKMTAVAKVRGQPRVAKVTIFRVLNDFGIFGMTDVSWKGNWSKASFNEVDSAGTSVSTGGMVNIGVGVGGLVYCNGGGTNNNVKVIGEPGSQVTTCKGSSISGSTVLPQQPTVCTSGQVSTAFAPCVDTSSFALEPSGAPNPGKPYCPMPTSSTLNLLPGIYQYQPATNPPPSSVFDCDSGGATITLSALSTDKIPPGSYYFTANNATVGPIAYQAISAQTNFFILPAACTSGNCAPATAPATGCASASAPATSLTLQGLINYNTAGITQLNPTGSNVADLAIYWGGCGAVSVGSGSNAANVAGDLYLPGGVIKDNGGKFVLDGQMVVGSYTTPGAPNFNFLFPEHQPQVLQGWTKTDYSISA